MSNFDLAVILHNRVAIWVLVINTHSDLHAVIIRENKCETTRWWWEKSSSMWCTGDRDWLQTWEDIWEVHVVDRSCWNVRKMADGQLLFSVKLVGLPFSTVVINKDLDVHLATSNLQMYIPPLVLKVRHLGRRLSVFCRLHRFGWFPYYRFRDCYTRRVALYPGLPKHTGEKLWRTGPFGDAKKKCMPSFLTQFVEKVADTYM